MPPYPMMFQGGSPDETQQPGDPISEQEALVRRLLSSLEPNVTPPPPQLSNSRRILGPLGDALMAMASVRAGGAPPQMGAFAAEQEKRRAAYEQRLTENARADRALRNSVRVGVMQAGGRQMIGPLDAAKLRLESERNAESAKYHRGLLDKPKTPREQVVYDSQNHAWILDLDTGMKRDAGLSKPPTQAQETAKRSSDVLKLRLGEARDLIERASGTAPTNPEFAVGHEATAPRSRIQRFGERIAAHDPTGWASGSDFAADASTYQSFINEIGSLTRTLYGAQGIRSYEEILRLINAMPPWTSGPKRIKQQFDALGTAIGVADSELQARRPDLYPETSAGSGTETPEQKKARIKAKYGLP